VAQTVASSTVVETSAYLSKAERLMTSVERADVVDRLASNPAIGRIIKGTGGLRKARIGFGGRGRRGGGRVIYWYHSQSYPVVLLWVFAKNETDDLTAAQRSILVREAEGLLEDFGGRR